MIIFPFFAVPLPALPPLGSCLNATGVDATGTFLYGSKVSSGGGPGKGGGRGPFLNATAILLILAPSAMPALNPVRHEVFPRRCALEGARKDPRGVCGGVAVGWVGRCVGGLSR